MAYRNGSGGEVPELHGVRASNWLHQLRQQIQPLDFRLHVSLRILADGEKNPDFLTAFVNTVVARDKMMARVISYVVALRKQIHSIPLHDARLSMFSRPCLSSQHAERGASRSGDPRPSESWPKP